MTTPSKEYLRYPCSCGGSNENCFKCGGWGYIDKINNDSKVFLLAGPKKTSSSSLGVKEKTELSSRSPIKTCNICGGEFLNLAFHTMDAHIDLPPKYTYLVPQRIIYRKLQCSKCSSKVREDRLQSHLKRVHGVLPLIRKIVANSKRIEPRNPGYREDRNLRDTEDQRLDATRNYYAAYRDHGQFGSHPSHDSYSDESEP